MNIILYSKGLADCIERSQINLAQVMLVLQEFNAVGVRREAADEQGTFKAKIQNRLPRKLNAHSAH